MLRVIDRCALLSDSDARDRADGGWAATTLPVTGGVPYDWMQTGTYLSDPLRWPHETGRTAMGTALAIEVTVTAVRALSVRGLRRWRRVRGYAERPLPPGLVVPSATAPNVRDEAAFTKLLAELVGPRPERQARLVLPDRVVRLHILEVEGAPPNGPDLRRFLLWRLRDSLPFDVREARVAYAVAPHRPPNGQLAIMLVAHEQVLAQYERLLGILGIGVAHLAPAACHLVNLAAQDVATSGDAVQALLSLHAGSATLILSQGGVPRYARTFLRPGVDPHFRPRMPGLQPPIPPGEPGRPASLKELAEELLRTLAHARDTVDLPAPTRLRLAGGAGQDAPPAPALAAILGIPCTTLPPPALRSQAGRPLPPQAWVVASVALAHIV